MKYHPILFSTPMVQAIQENRKTQTRRTKGLELFNENSDRWRYDGICELDNSHYMELISPDGKFTEKYFEVKCPYNVGDVFWVRETFYEQDIASLHFRYKADFTSEMLDKLKSYQKWKPSLFMPKEACRIFLKIKSIRVERIWEISEEDAIAEGIEKIGKNSLGISLYKEYFLKSELPCYAASNSFRSLWKKINGEESWYKNPFVWVYEFEKIEKPEDFVV